MIVANNNFHHMQVDLKKILSKTLEGSAQEANLLQEQFIKKYFVEKDTVNEALNQLRQEFLSVQSTVSDVGNIYKTAPMTSQKSLRNNLKKFINTFPWENDKDLILYTYKSIENNIFKILKALNISKRANNELDIYAQLLAKSYPENYPDILVQAKAKTLNMTPAEVEESIDKGEMFPNQFYNRLYVHDK